MTAGRAPLRVRPTPSFTCANALTTEKGLYWKSILVPSLTVYARHNCIAVPLSEPRRGLIEVVDRVSTRRLGRLATQAPFSDKANISAFAGGPTRHSCCRVLFG
jgi:hypothetical protein